MVEKGDVLINKMDKLKTLKDLELIRPAPEILKQEAIKWIKEIRDFKQPTIYKIMDTICNRTTTYSEEARIGVITFIKYFFNITEDDLK